MNSFPLLLGITRSYFLAILIVNWSRACSPFGGSFVRYFDSEFTTENVFGTGLAADESSGHVYLATSLPALLKINTLGAIDASRSLGSWWVYAVELSADKTKIVAVADAFSGGIIILSTTNLSPLFEEKFSTASVTLRAVTSNENDKWYALGTKDGN